jgi:hypothetical protein
LSSVMHEYLSLIFIVYHVWELFQKDSLGLEMQNFFYACSSAKKGMF